MSIPSLESTWPTTSNFSILPRLSSDRPTARRLQIHSQLRIESFANMGKMLSMNDFQKTCQVRILDKRKNMPSGIQKIRADGRLAFRTPEPEVDLRETGRMTEMISTLSHEFRTPLASMKSSLSLVLRGEAGPLGEDQRHFLGMTLRNIERLDRMVGDLLYVGRAHAGKLPLRLRGVDLGPLLAEAVAMQQTAAQDAGLILDDSAVPASFTAHLDPDKVVQMLANLLSNSIKYCRPGSTVRVSLESAGSKQSHPAVRQAEEFGVSLRTFELIVQDDGPGIDPDRMDEVFEPYGRSHEEVGSGIPGAGLGLSIVRRLAEAHAGSVRLTSAAGRGTTVRILLPRDEASGRWMRARSGSGRNNSDLG
jgi:signal transduction histidine kinase